MSALSLRRALPTMLVAAAGLLTAAPAHAWEHNIAKWPEARLPLPIILRPEPARDTSNEELAVIVEAAIETWNAVSCSSGKMRWEGVQDVPIAIDGQQVLGWVDSDWIYGSQAAGATQIDIGDENGPRVDIRFNDVNFDWVVGASTFVTPDYEFGVDPNLRVDPASVVTHEIGHLLGLAHPNANVPGSQPDPNATMAAALLPNAQQSSLAADDRLGLCAKYPIPGASGCETDQDCAEYEVCETFVDETLGELRLCDEVRSLWGEDCGRADFNCQGFCLFTSADYRNGYCTSFCETHADCPTEPEAWHCETLPTTTGTADVCQRGAPDEPDVEDDAEEQEADVAETSDASDTSTDASPELEEDAELETETPGDGEGGSKAGCAAVPSRESNAPLLALVALLALRRRRT